MSLASAVKKRVRTVPWIFAPAAVVLAIGCSAVLAQEDSPGRRQFLNACGVCHAAEPGAPPRQGPNLHGVYGRKAASLEGFKYSEALKASGFTWDETTLDTWLTDAQAARPGTIMLYRQANPERRQLVIDYLKSLQ